MTAHAARVSLLALATARREQMAAFEAYAAAVLWSVRVGMYVTTSPVEGHKYVHAYARVRGGPPGTWLEEFVEAAGARETKTGDTIRRLELDHRAKAFVVDRITKKIESEFGLKPEALERALRIMSDDGKAAS